MADQEPVDAQGLTLADDWRDEAHDGDLFTYFGNSAREAGPKPGEAYKKLALARVQTWGDEIYFDDPNPILAL